MNLLKKLFEPSRAGGKEAPLYGGQAAISYSDPKTVDFRDAINLNPWVNAAVTRKAQAVAKGKWRLYRYEGTGDNRKKVEMKGHRAEAVLKKPNDNMSHSEFIEQISVDLDSAGESFWNIRFAEGQIWHLDPDKMEIHKNPGGRGIKKYVFRNDDGQDLSFLPEEVLHIVYIRDTKDRWRGTSPLRAAAITIDGDIYADNWNKNFFKNAARPDGILYSEKAVDKATRREWITSWKEKFFGTKRGSIGVLSGGVKYEKVGDGQKDMDFAKLGDAAQKKILAVLGVPREILGDMGRAATDTAESSRISFFSDTVFPRLCKIAENLTLQFLQEYYGEEIFLEYDDPTPENRELKIKERESNIKIGARVPNELREEDGLEPIEGGERLYIGLKDDGKTPGEESKDDEPKPPKDEPVDPEDEMDLED